MQARRKTFKRQIQGNVNINVVFLANLLILIHHVHAVVNVYHSYALNCSLTVGVLQIAFENIRGGELQ